MFVPKPAEARKAEVAIFQKGVRLHWKGGTVRPTGRTSEATGKPTKSLLIPFADSPLRKRRVTLAELHLPADSIHVLKSRNGCPILAATKSLKTRTNLVWLGKLVKAASFRPRPEVLPAAEALQRSAISCSLGMRKFSVTPIGLHKHCTAPFPESEDSGEPIPCDTPGNRTHCAVAFGYLVPPCQQRIGDF